MVKIVCDKDDEYIAKNIVNAVQTYGMCPPVDCDNSSADCKKCVANWLEIEVVKCDAKQDKVIKGLEYCMNNTGCDACEKCAYGGESYVICNRLVKDAIELLKEKQPRVLDYEELFHEETFSLWFEDKEHLLLLHVACVDGEYEDMHVNVAVEDNYENWSTYGKTWRMWSEMPTDEQRKAVPWKDGDGE